MSERSIADIVDDALYTVTFDAATDGCDFNERNFLRELLKQLMRENPRLWSRFEATRARALKDAAEAGCGEPVGTFTLPGGT